MRRAKSRTSLIKRYKKLINISCELASELDLNILLHKIVNAACEVSNSEEASILLYDPIKDTLYFQAATNLDSNLKKGLAVPLVGSIAGWIITYQKAIIVDNPQKDKRHFDDIGKITSIDCKSLLGIPLMSKGNVIGVLEVINKRGGKFNKEDQDVLLALGAQATVAIETSRLFLQSDLIGEFVHEIRTPLSALSAATHLLKSSRVTEDQKKKMLGILEVEIDALADMSSSFLDLARLESGRKHLHVSKFDLKDLLSECCEMIDPDIKGHHLYLTADFPETLPPVIGDRKQLKQAFINLLNNSIKFNKIGGKIIIKASAKNKKINISISDSGLGIPADEQELIFEKFYRVKSHRENISGTGLGLSVVKKIIKNHSGEISFTSKVDQGTTFTVILPAETDPSLR